MALSLTVAVVMAIAAAGLAATGWWRFVLWPARIRPARMTAEKLGLITGSGDDATRVDRILESFAGGFNAMIAARSGQSWRRYCASLPVFYRPFAHEGAAMGYTLRCLFRYRPGDFENRLVRPAPEFRYLYYVGLGFWSGMRNHDSGTLNRIVGGLDPLHRYLCYDGYGFKQAFFDYPTDPGVLRRLDTFDGYARNAAYQGVGRAFWFRFMGRRATLVEHVRALGPMVADVAAGVGLALAFTNVDRLERALAVADRLPVDWHEHVHLGMCFGLKARSVNDRHQFDADLSRLSPNVQEAVCASIRECDRVELQVRADGRSDGYRRWRAGVTDWMARHIEYPLSGVRRTAPDASTLELPHS